MRYPSFGKKNFQHCRRMKMDLFVSNVQSAHRILIIVSKKEYKMAKEACLMTFCKLVCS
jgi:hypothetical protein